MSTAVDRPASTLAAIRVERIPAILKELPRWVAWGYELREDRWTKVPINPATGGGASTTDPYQWSIFEDAFGAAKDRDFDGVGFVFAEGDGLVGIDLDYCLGDDGRPVPEAQAIIDSLDSYAEVSPSGRGVKIFARGTLPGEGKGRRMKPQAFGQIEIYCRSRFFTVTGWPIDGTPASVNERQAQVDALLSKYFAKEPKPSETRPPSENGDAVFAGTDDDLIALAGAAANGAKFKRLWEGDTGGYPSGSEADLALCSLIAFYSGHDPARIDRIFRRSKLCDGKWLGREDYRHSTISKAIEGRNKFYSGGERARETSAGGKRAATPPRSEFGITKALAMEIQGANHYAQDLGGKLYAFASGVYRAGGEDDVRRRVKRTLDDWGLDKKWSSKQANEVVEYVRVDSPTLWERPPVDTLNLRNGLLDIETRELRPHEATYLSPVQLSVAYDADAKCPAWESFVGQTFPPDCVSIAWEIPACLMVPGLHLKTAILLVGEGDNGKSVYLHAVTNFLGRRNVAAVSLHRLESDRFSLARLVGRLANVCPDLSSEHLKGTSVFKTITGGDVVEAERKFKDAFEFQPYSRLVFSANTLPQSQDAGDAFYRRWKVVPFLRRFEPKDQIPRAVLDASLANPRELSGLLNRALDVLPALALGGYSSSESTERALVEFRQTTEPLLIWLQLNTVKAAGALVAKEELYAAYCLHANETARPMVTKNAFGRAVKSHCPEVEEKQRTMGGCLCWCWIGLQLAS